MFPYSFKDTVGGFSDPDVGAFAFAGEIGIGRFVVSMATERTVLSTAADGAILGSSIAGNSGQVSIEVQQTSSLHKFLLQWLNAKLARQRNGDVSTWFSAALSIRNITTGTSHTLTGLAPSKMADVPYEAQGQNVTWVLLAADVINQ